MLKKLVERSKVKDEVFIEVLSIVNKYVDKHKNRNRTSIGPLVASVRFMVEMSDDVPRYKAFMHTDPIIRKHEIIHRGYNVLMECYAQLSKVVINKRIIVDKDRSIINQVIKDSGIETYVHLYKELFEALLCCENCNTKEEVLQQEAFRKFLSIEFLSDEIGEP